MTARRPPSFAPWPAAVLAVDTARTSGWSVLVRGALRAAGEVAAFDLGRVTDVCRVALGTAPELPVVLVLERAFAHHRMGRGASAATVGGIAAATEMWRQAWASAGGVRRRVVRVYPATWRAAVLGPGMGSARREAAREAEQRVAQAFAERAGLEAPGPDAAAAICIGLWAARSGEVGAVLPARTREACA